MHAVSPAGGGGGGLLAFGIPFFIHRFWGGGSNLGSSVVSSELIVVFM